MQRKRKPTSGWKIKQGITRVLYIIGWVVQTQRIILKMYASKAVAVHPHRHLCLRLGLLEEGFLDPVKWLDEVDGGAAGEDAPGGEGGDVRGLDAAGGEEAGEGGAGRRESHRRR